ncbi:type II secretion system protein GspI [Sphingorhabdus lutea]|uniref:Type II secretion system protein I n=1 Tax=Sphingorhabdus lutea TaxID=1913578 RepID=A0A1L3JEH0_9SPHN|nr:type II secretion system minor pseudopilin GspI [Sphingorhabdus lutea]APG63525.1 type II secretion system protein GspI [Sphingorhabdus lutea]
MTNGFTMLEIMVALAIFSLAAMALIRLQGFTMREGGAAIAHQILWLEARNKAANIISDPNPIAFGDLEGVSQNAGRKFQWVQKVRRSDDEHLARVDIIITDEQGKQAIIKFGRPVTP